MSSLNVSASEGEATFVNRGWTEYVGLSFEDIHGRGWARTAHPDDLEAFAAKWRASLAAGRPLEEEVRFRRADVSRHRPRLPALSGRNIGESNAERPLCRQDPACPRSGTDPVGCATRS